MSESSCPICRSQNLLSYPNAINGIWQNYHNVFYCKGCGLYFLNDVTQEETVSYYTSEYYKMHEKEIEKMTITFFIKSLFRYFRSKSQFRFVSPYLTKNIKTILEVGAGDGTFLNLFKKRGFSISGFEYNNRMRDIAKKKYNITLENSDFLSDSRKFDIILMSHVYEHFLDLDSVTQKIHNSLTDDGFVFIEVPNSPWIQEASEPEIRAYLNSTHIYNFNLENITRYLNRYGFEIIEAGRYYYRMPIILSRKAQKHLADLFLMGEGGGFMEYLFAAYYTVRSIILPSRSYKLVKNDNDWLGSGDNIRILAKKK